MTQGRPGSRSGPGCPRLVDVSELAGTRVMVTGATSGLGAAMAAALSAAGVRVVATSRRLGSSPVAAMDGVPIRDRPRTWSHD